MWLKINQYESWLIVDSKLVMLQFLDSKQVTYIWFPVELKWISRKFWFLTFWKQEKNEVRKILVCWTYWKILNIIRIKMTYVINNKVVLLLAGWYSLEDLCLMMIKLTMYAQRRGVYLNTSNKLWIVFQFFQKYQEDWSIFSVSTIKIMNNITYQKWTKITNEMNI